VPLLIVNGPALEHATGTISNLPERYRLYPQDEAVLRENYVPHWGRIWVAGKRVVVTPAGSLISIMVPGIYTVEGAPVQIDGYEVNAGSTVTLHRGVHNLRSPTLRVVTLRWGDHLYKPAKPPSAERLY
jgi:hypothetical protein